jgi:hypothetical protein
LWALRHWNLSRNAHHDWLSIHCQEIHVKNRLEHRAGPAASSDSDQRPPLEYIPGRLILRVVSEAVASSVGLGALSMTPKSAELLPDALSKPLQYLKENAGLKTVTPLFSTKQAAHARMKGGGAASVGILSSVAHTSNEDLAGLNVLSVDAKQVTPALMRRLNQSNAIEFVERMPARYLFSNTAPDPEVNVQRGLRAIRWFQATRPAAHAIKVAVLDSGIDQTHPELKTVIDRYEHAGKSATDIIGHGTHVAGTIAALTNNGVGVAGVSDCKLLIWKIFGDEPFTDGRFYVDDEAYLRALNEVRNSGARVLNLSIGGTASSQTEQLLFNRLTQAGVTTIAAMGNEFKRGNRTSFPAAYETVLAVGAVGADLRRASFSNTGKHIAVSAPGVQILSTLPMKKALPHREETAYAAWDGTSMATPHVAGAAALFCAKTAGATPEEVQTALINTCRRLPEMRARKRSDEVGAGIIDVSKLLAS